MLTKPAPPSPVSGAQPSTATCVPGGPSEGVDWTAAQGARPTQRLEPLPVKSKCVSSRAPSQSPLGLLKAGRQGKMTAYRPGPSGATVFPANQGSAGVVSWAVNWPTFDVDQSIATEPTRASHAAQQSWAWSKRRWSAVVPPMYPVSSTVVPGGPDAGVSVSQSPGRLAAPTSPPPFPASRRAVI